MVGTAESKPVADFKAQEYTHDDCLKRKHTYTKVNC